MRSGSNAFWQPVPEATLAVYGFMTGILHLEVLVPTFSTGEQVFTTAAGDKEESIVQLAFDTIQIIVREHFSHITETETTTFTDCVNCLIAFTNNPHSSNVALNSIAFLRCV